MKKNNKLIIKVFDHAGSFAEDKDEGAHMREKLILPALKEGKQIIIDYASVTTTTQSFTHALISEALRTYDIDKTLDLLIFKNCNESVKRIISIVVEYMQRRLE